MKLESVKYRFVFLLKYSLLIALVSILSGTASAFFLFSLDWATNWRENHLWIVWFLPISGFIVGLVYHYFGDNAERGNNLLIENVQEAKEPITWRMAPLVYLGTIATHLFGGSAGREGTALQMAGSMADQLSKPFNLSAEQRKTLLIAAIAAGFGSVFGTPLAGAVFALEVCIVGNIRYQSVFAAFFAAIGADMVTKLWGTPHTHYSVAEVPNITFAFFTYSLATGAVFGLAAIVFAESMHRLSNFYKIYIKWPPLRPFLGGIMVVALFWLVGTSKYLGLGIPTIVTSFAELLPAYDFLLKIIFTVLTVSAGLKGGEVTPLFFIGATLGNALAYFVPLPLGLLSGMGFVAVFAAATNTPIACTIMAVELLGVECGVYAAIACLVAYYVSGSSTIYSAQLKPIRKNE